jgi:hypothetical protein
MWKKVLAGTAALVIVGTGLVYAQSDRRPDGWRVWGPPTEDLNAYADARVAALHAGLKLNADQEKIWPAFEQALRAFAAVRIAQRDEMRGGPRGDTPVDRWQRQAELLSTRGAALKKLADAAGPLYRSLDDAQKRRFLVLTRIGQTMAAAWDRPRMGPGGPDGWMGPHHGFGGPRGMEGFRGHPGFEGRRGMMGPGSDDGRRGPRDQDERL